MMLGSTPLYSKTALVTLSAKSAIGTSMMTTAGASQPSSTIFWAAPAPMAKFDPVTNETGLDSSISAIGQHEPKSAMFSSSRIGISWLKSNENEPTRATAPSSAAWRPQLASSLGSPRPSQRMTSSGRPLIPPWALSHSP